MALLTDGTVLTWGGSLHKKLGTQVDPHSIYFYEEDADEIQDLLEHPLNTLIVKDLYKKVIIDVSCADFHSVALEDTGIVYTWGGGGSSYNKG